MQNSGVPTARHRPPGRRDASDHVAQLVKQQLAEGGPGAQARVVGEQHQRRRLWPARILLVQQLGPDRERPLLDVRALVSPLAGPAARPHRARPPPAGIDHEHVLRAQAGWQLDRAVPREILVGAQGHARRSVGLGHHGAGAGRRGECPRNLVGFR